MSLSHRFYQRIFTRFLYTWQSDLNVRLFSSIHVYWTKQERATELRHVSCCTHENIWTTDTEHKSLHSEKQHLKLSFVFLKRFSRCVKMTAISLSEILNTDGREKPCKARGLSWQVTCVCISLPQGSFKQSHLFLPVVTSHPKTQTTSSILNLNVWCLSFNTHHWRIIMCQLN